MRVEIDPGDLGPKVCTTLASFLSENADAIDEREAADIAAALAQWQAYYGGGGASGEWSIARVFD
jgi:hypothetical protein